MTATTSRTKPSPATEQPAPQPAAKAARAPASKVAKKVAKKAAKKVAAPAGASKAPQAGKATKPTKPTTAPAPKKEPKLKIVRDSFTMPEFDFALIDAIKARALAWQLPVKKSEVLRAALQALQALPDDQARALLANLAPIKKGRPKAKA